MNRTDKILKSAYILALTTCVVIAILFETCLEYYKGIFHNPDDLTVQGYFDFLVEMLTIFSVYAALRMSRLKSVQARIQEPSFYLRMALCRFAALSVSLLMAVLVHYLFYSTGIFFCIPILILAMLFVWPSTSRRMTEMMVEEEECEPQEKL